MLASHSQQGAALSPFALNFLGVPNVTFCLLGHQMSPTPRKRQAWTLLDDTIPASGPQEKRALERTALGSTLLEWEGGGSHPRGSQATIGTPGMEYGRPDQTRGDALLRV